MIDVENYYVTDNTRRLWNVELDMADVLLKVCQRFNLRIWAYFGTLLGAARHKGFIPWDDDLDFVMMREDYNRLLEIGPSEFKYPYFFQSVYTDKQYGCMVKIRNSKTTMLEEGYEEFKTSNRGCSIDVFVLDVVPDDEKEFYKEYKRVRWLRRMVDNYNLLNTSKLSGKRKLLNIVNHIVVSFFNVDRLQSAIVRILSKPNINNNKFVATVDFYASLKYDISRIKVRESQSYDETFFLPFHDMMLPVPKDYHSVLTNLYHYCPKKFSHKVS